MTLAPPAGRVLVVGGGIAGSAAAWEARRNGARVMLFGLGPGASALTSGAVHGRGFGLAGGTPRHRAAGSRAPGESPALSTDLEAFAEALGLWTLPSGGCWLATQSGVCLEADGHDRAVLDLQGVAGGQVGVVEAGPGNWDGASLALALSSSPWARQTGTRFVPVSVGACADGEHRVPVADFAALHDEPGRVARLGDSLRKAGGSLDGWLLGPWLGSRTSPTSELEARAEKPVGETTSLPGETAGVRLEGRAAALVRDSGAEVLRGGAVSITEKENAVEIYVESSSGGQHHTGDAAVLAVGGVLSGGICMSSLSEVGAGKGAFRLSVEVPAGFELGGMAEGPVSSQFGVDLLELGLGALARVGIRVHEARVMGGSRVFAAGDGVAERPRTVLEAAGSGLLAGRAAALS